MKQNLYILLLLVSLSSYCQTLSRQQKDSLNNIYFEEKEKSNKEIINKPFPAFSALYNGEVFNKSYLKGKTVFINFWFESCAPCIAEMDAFNEMYDKLKDKRSFEFISFTFETKEKIQEIKDKYNIQYKVISIKQEDCYRLNNNNGFPTNIIIDSLGFIKYLSRGGTTDKAKAKDFVMKTILPEILKIL